MYYIIHFILYSVLVWLRKAKKAPPGRPSAHWGAEENEKKTRAGGMEYPALFGEVGSACPAVSLPGFW